MLMLRIKKVMVMGLSILIQGRQDRIRKIEKVFDIFHSMSLHFVDIYTVNKLTILLSKSILTLIF